MRMGADRTAARAWLLSAVVIVMIVATAVFAVVRIRGSHGCPASSATCRRGLFIGNSLTFVNDLPHTFAALAGSGHHEVETDMLAAGGAKLSDFANASSTQTKIDSKPWNIVVLQDQSDMGTANLPGTEMIPAAQTLNAIVRNHGAIPLLYLTWGHRDGWPGAGVRDYATMQDETTTAYRDTARSINAPIAPVGEAWRDALAHHAGIELYQPDGNHPTVAGTYLAACVFYATIFGTSPEGLTYRAGLSPGDAAELQRIAARTVLTNRAAWRLALIPGNAAATAAQG